MADAVISVKEFLEIVNETLGFAYPQVIVAGEVSGFNRRDYNVYFSLKDSEAILPCYIYARNLDVELEDGMNVRVTGSPKVLTKSGKFSFTARSVELAGEGELKRAFELLKAKLEQEGLFAPERKRQLPSYPASIGLITSRDADAYHDFMKILNGRWAGVTVQFAHVGVQGVAAPAQIAAAIEHFNQQSQPPDVLVVIRGGGSLEDLQAFNTEPVARAIAGSRVPTVVGVGHEADVTLADLAADVRAATPTDAAGRVVPDRREVARQIDQITANIQRTLSEKTSRRVDELTGSLQRYWDSYLSGLSARVQLATRLLGTLDPKATLKRGYSIVRAGDQVVKRANQVSAGQKLVIQLAEGKLKSQVTGHE